jgi:hypothetical protein
MQQVRIKNGSESSLVRAAVAESSQIQHSEKGDPLQRMVAQFIRTHKRNRGLPEEGRGCCEPCQALAGGG